MSTAPSPAESAIQDMRAEWITSAFDADGIPRPPEDPQWNRFSDYIDSYPGWSADAGVEGQQATGSGDVADHFRGTEEHDIGVNFWLQRFFIDSNGDPNGPIGELLTHDYTGAFPCHELLFRRESDDGGSKGSGYREYIYASGCRPSSATLPGDPAASNPIIAEAGYACEMVRQYVIHQPSTSVTPVVSSTSDNDDTQSVTIESEGADTAETLSLNGRTEVTATASFPDIDAIWVDGDHEGDIMVTDGNGNDLLEDPIVGSDTDGVESFRGVPALGSGSHSAAIGNDPSQYQFLGTSSTYSGGALAKSAPADRVHALDLDVEADISRDERQGTRRQAIDPGMRTVTVEPNLAGQYETAKQQYNYLTGHSGDLVYGFPDGDVTVKNAQSTDTDDVDRAAGDANQVYGITLEGSGDPAIEVTRN